MRFCPTKQQQLALDARGSVLVSAAAGSGKTAVLSNRVAQRVLDSDDPINIGDMLIVTFTNAAAAEMRERISSVLAEKAAETLSFRALEQKAAVDTASICTIDSFCIDFIRDNFELAGVSPDFKIASNEQLAVMKSRAMDKAVSAFMLAEPERFRRVAAMLGAEYGYGNLTAAVSKIYEFTRSLPFPDVWLDWACERYSPRPSVADTDWAQPLFLSVYDTAEYYYMTLSVAITSARDEGFDAYLPALCNHRDVLLAIMKAAENRDYSAVRDIATRFSPTRLGRLKAGEISLQFKEQLQTLNKSAVAAIRSLAERFGASESECLADIASAGECVRAVADTVKAYSASLDEQMRDSRLYGFADIEHMTLDMLCEPDENGGVRIKNRALTGRFKEVLVDEYQDTNDLQNAIFYALSDEGRNLFIVGDVKQSIYRFRRANPANFIRRKDAYPEYDGSTYPSKITLSGNFRSRRGVCDFTNFLFRLIMSKRNGDMDYLPDDELDPKGTFPELPEGESEVELHIVASKDEAAYVAQYIRNAVDSEMKVSDSSGGLRPVRYGDFIVMLRSGALNEEYTRCMRELNIPAVCEAKGQFFDCEEVMMMLSLLHAVDNPLRDVDLLATLMLPMFGFTAEETAEMRANHRKGSLYSALVAFAATSAHAAEFLHRLEKYRAWAASVPVDRLITLISDDTGFSAVIGAMNGGADRRANLLLLCEFARSYKAGGFKGLSPFLRYIETLKKNGSNIERASAGGSGDAVRIMTIHRSKGLQAPVCILGGLTKHFNTADLSEDVIINENMGIGLRVYDDSLAMGFDTLPRSVIAAEERRALISEEMRLLYVALTRAQDRLVLVSADEKYDSAISKAAVRVAADWGSETAKVDPYVVGTSASLSGWIYAACLMHPDAKALRDLGGLQLKCAETSGRLAVKTVDDFEPSVAQNEQTTEYESRDFSAQLDYIYPYESLMKVESKYSVSQLAKTVYSPRYCCTSRPAFIAGSELTPAERGTATHEFMCFADFDRAEKSVADEVQRLVSVGRLNERQARAIDLDAVAAFFESNIYSRIRRADRVLKESRFIYEMPASEIEPDCPPDESVVVQGVADCVFFEGDTMTVLDFKTDRGCTEGELIEKYAKQLKIYTDAFSANYHLTAKTPYIYSFSLKKAIAVPMKSPEAYDE